MKIRIGTIFVFVVGITQMSTKGLACGGCTLRIQFQANLNSSSCTYCVSIDQIGTTVAVTLPDSDRYGPLPYGTWSGCVVSRTRP
ncbi:MAG: hypothetical protein LBJ92_02140 [Holosporales bacterium]|jgi:hypothetical protein|nr:hypothetical protein [Holosporales bacterium]